MHFGERDIAISKTDTIQGIFDNNVLILKDANGQQLGELYKTQQIKGTQEKRAPCVSYITVDEDNTFAGANMYWLSRKKMRNFF